MALDPGARLGPYEIVGPIGAGGMGEVYKAVDPRLNRIVAIKVSKEQFSERLEREARAVAALNRQSNGAVHVEQEIAAQSPRVARTQWYETQRGDHPLGEQKRRCAGVYQGVLDFDPANLIVG